MAHRSLYLLLLALSAAHLAAQPPGYSFENAQEFLSTYCKTCHQGKSPAGGFDVRQVSTPASLAEERRWTSLSSRVRQGEMPCAPSFSVKKRRPFPVLARGRFRRRVNAGTVSSRSRAENGQRSLTAQKGGRERPASQAHHAIKPDARKGETPVAGGTGRPRRRGPMAAGGEAAQPSLPAEADVRARPDHGAL